jgi:hypothetical protein
MKKAWPRYLGLGVLAYLIFLVTTFPAVRAYPLLKDSLAPLALYDLEGTVWSGRARTAELGPYRMGALSWHSYPWKLLLGRLEFAWMSTEDAAKSHGVAARGLGGRLHLSEVNANLPVAELSAFLIPTLPLKSLGMLRIELNETDIGDNRILATDGVISLENVVFLTPQPVSLGSLTLTLSTVDTGIKGTLLDKGGALQAQGVLMLKPDGSYQFTGTLASRDRNQPQIQQALAFLGKPTADGKVAVNWSGKLPFGKVATAGATATASRIF